MSAFVLWTVVLLTWVVVLRTNRRVSLVLVACLGLTIYSVSALSGWVFPLSSLRHWERVTDAGRYGMALGWLGFLVSVSVASLGRRPAAQATAHPNQPPAGAPRPIFYDAPARNFMLVAILASLAGFGYAIYRGGPLFFLPSREQVFQLIYGAPFLLWRWVNVVGLNVAVASRRPLPFAFFLGAVLINFLMGDRTVIVLGGMAALMAGVWQTPVIRLFRNRWIIGGGVGLVIITLFGKAIYTAVKSASLTSASHGFVLDLNNTLMNFEPFMVQHLMDSVIQYNLTISSGDLLMGIVGQLLIAPSLFGIDSGAYNVLITNTLFPTVTFGIAFSFWAQGYSWLGYFGIFLYGVIFGSIAIVLTRTANRSGLLWRSFWIICGTVIGIYAHRNSLENIIAVVRQAFLAFFPLLLLAYLPRALRRR
ncbi:MAG: hypothetical protein ACM3W4_05995 [Ignavibacteriales bacterium]